MSPNDVHTDDLRPGIVVSRNVIGVQDWSKNLSHRSSQSDEVSQS